MAHKGKATSDVTYNPDDGPEAYNNLAIYNRLHDYTAMAQEVCWGEGEDATLRSMPSSPRYTNEDHARAVSLHPLDCNTKARL
jgi:hypothetical protein